MRILISGTSSGIGRHLADRLTAEGHEIWGLARSPQHAHFMTSVCDVANWAQVLRARDSFEQRWNSVDAVICAAAIQGAIGPAMQADPNRWSETVRVNLDGTFYVIRAFWELLRAAPRRAKVICFSGGGATKARPNFCAYAASKTGVVRLVENLAAEWSELSVDINALAPGAINTVMTRQVVRLGARVVGLEEFETAKRQLESGGQPIGKVDEIVEFLLSGKSDGISGRLLAAQWDDWRALPAATARLAASEVFQLRRIVPEDRAMKF